MTNMTAQPPLHRLLPDEVLARARCLRREQTTPEDLIWSLLRDRRFAGLKFRRQHPVGPYIADFYCAALCWVIEVDGGQHNTEDARRYDQRRTDFLVRRGITVTRLWSNEVTENLEGVVGCLLDVGGRLQAVRGGRTEILPGAQNS